MVLHDSGTAIKASEINTELGYAPTTFFSLNSAEARALAGKPGDGTLIKYSDFYNKSNLPPGDGFNILLIGNTDYGTANTFASNLGVVINNLSLTYTVNMSFLYTSDAYYYSDKLGNIITSDGSIPYDPVASVVFVWCDQNGIGYNASGWATNLNSFTEMNQGVVLAPAATTDFSYNVFTYGSYSSNYQVTSVSGFRQNGPMGAVSQFGQNDSGTGILNGVTSAYVYGVNSAFGTAVNGATQIGTIGLKPLVAFQDFGPYYSNNYGRRVDLNFSVFQNTYNLINDVSNSSSMRVIANALLWAGRAI